jgi:hypothetical protein
VLAAVAVRSVAGLSGPAAVTEHVRAALTGSGVMLAVGLVVVLVLVVPARRSGASKGALAVPGSTDTATPAGAGRAWTS